jgi:hypothetical protein
MTDTYALVPLREFIASLAPVRHFESRPRLDQFDAADDLSVRHYTTDAILPGDVDFDALMGQNIAGIVVDGDLEVTGDILNWEIDTTAAFLWVRGNLRCRNIVFGSMDLVVQDHVTAAGLMVVPYDHGYLSIAGDVDADRVIIDDDGSATIGGMVGAKGWTSSPKSSAEIRRSDWIHEIRPEFRDEFFDSQGYMKCLNGNADLVKALLAGRDILLEDASRAIR